MAEPLITTTELEEFRSGDPDALLAAASREVRSYCGWHIAPSVTETVTVEGSGAALLLPTLHLTGITSIAQNGIAVNLTNIDWTPNGVVTGYAFTGKFVVTFTHGYDMTPEDIAQAVASITSDGIDGHRRVKSWNRGPFGESFYDEDPDRATLDRYRIQAGP